jgi:hypothetical protein
MLDVAAPRPLALRPSGAAGGVALPEDDEEPS